MASPEDGEDFCCGFSVEEGEEERPGRDERARLIQMLEDEMTRETSAPARTRPRLNLEDEPPTQEHKRISSSVAKSQKKTDPSFGSGTGSRKKVKFLDKYPSKTLPHSKLPKTDSVLLSLRPLAEQTLDFCLTEYQRGSFPRGDYKELLELSIICLGGDVAKFQFRLPGAVHHARWMAKGIYFLKIYLLGDLFAMKDSEKENVRRQVTFVLLVYIRFWFRTPLSTAAPRVDLELYHDVIKYREVESYVAFNVLHKIRLHLWYLTPRLVVLALCDKGLEDVERKNIALTIFTKAKVDKKFETGKPEFPTIGWGTNGPPAISSFITEESWLLFNLCGIKTREWLMALYHLPCEMWGNVTEYAKFESVVSNMAIINDSGERALSMMDKYYNKIRGNSEEKEKERQDLLQVVQHYRRENPDLLKASLAKK